MVDFTGLFPKDLYHSYIIEGDPEITASGLLSFLENKGEIEKRSGDVLCQLYQSFTIDDSEEIKDWHSKLGIGNKKRVCIIATNFINREAEQTLLKMIEEPAKNTHFFIIIPDKSVLASTILSRTHVIKLKKADNEEIQKIAIKFVSSASKERLDIVADIIKDNKNEENSGQLRSYVTLFINELEMIFYKKFKEDLKNEKAIFVLEELQKNRKYLNNPGASAKMILEHLALVI